MNHRYIRPALVLIVVVLAGVVITQARNQDHPAAVLLAAPTKDWKGEKAHKVVRVIDGDTVVIDHALRREGTVANRRVEQKLYLHRTCVPLDVVDLEHEKTLFRPLANECQGVCGV